MNTSNPNNFLEQNLAELEVVAISFSRKFIPDAKVRRDYIKQTKRFAEELRTKVSNNQISPQKAAQFAQSMRTKSSPLGLSFARFMKANG